MSAAVPHVASQPASIGIPRRAVLVVTAAVAFAFGLLLMPGPRAHAGEIVGAAGFAVAAIVLSTLWNRSRYLALLGTPLAYVGMVAVLLDGGGGTRSGFGGLYLLPLLWLAILGGRPELLVGFVAVAIARILPVKLIGPPRYPAEVWRTGVILGSVALVACVTIQQLIRVARERAGALALQNEQLRELDEAKDAFVALVSHELRTPLTSIAGYAEMLLEGDDPLTDEQRQFLGTVERNTHRLATLVNELLFLAEVDAGRLELQLAEIDIRQLLLEATEAARPAAEAKQIELTLEAEDVAPAVCDRERLAQLVDNLLSNALKFTPVGGRVAVRADRSGSAVALSISDTGIGIPAAEVPRLFDRFYRASTAVGEGIPGTGLGLAISQAIAEAHDSTITVQSTPSEGTTFRLLLATA